jgi:hypothetical protein
MRDSPGRNSFSICSCFSAVSPSWLVRPVILPPGRAKLAMNPAPRGSLGPIMTIGIVCVRWRVASVACELAAIMMLGWSATSSAASFW